MQTENVSQSVKRPFIKKEPKIISFLNNKGGVGKSTLCFLTGKHFLRNNREIVVCDYDQQENVSKLLPEHTQGSIKAEELKELECDYCLVDTSPTFGMQHISLMKESDILVVPFSLDRLDIEQTTNLLETSRALNVTDKVHLVIMHSGKHTQLYKTLRPFVDNLIETYGVKVLCELRRNPYVPKAILESKTVFEITSPPDIRQEFKTLFSNLGKELSQCQKH
jgi:cellulose biosynthesis protein BcsQ